MTVNNRYIWEFSSRPWTIHKCRNGNIHCMIYLLWSVTWLCSCVYNTKPTTVRPEQTFLWDIQSFLCQIWTENTRRTAFLVAFYYFQSLILEAQKQQKTKSKWMEKRFLKKDLSQNRSYWHPVIKSSLCLCAVLQEIALNSYNIPFGILRILKPPVKPRVNTSGWSGISTDIFPEPLLRYGWR